jgi:predicted nucleotidyltransferase
MIPLIEQHKAGLVDLCRQFNVRRLDLFGSAARGAFRPESSDLDFLVTLEAGSAGEFADAYLDFANALEQLFQRRVDLVTERSIRNCYFQQAVDATRLPLDDARGEKAPP